LRHHAIVLLLATGAAVTTVGRARTVLAAPPQEKAAWAANDLVAQQPQPHTAAPAQTSRQIPPANEPTRPPETPDRGRHVISVSASYGNAVEINGSVPTDTAALWVRWTRRLAKHFAGGEPAWGVEIVPLLRVEQRPRAFGGGAHLVYEHRFVPANSVRPVFRAGAGMVFTNHKVPVGETRYNFSLFAGAGVEIDVGKHQWLTVEYRLHHVSNADTGVRNPGINSHTIGFGFSWGY